MGGMKERIYKSANHWNGSLGGLYISAGHPFGGTAASSQSTHAHGDIIIRNTFLDVMAPSSGGDSPPTMRSSNNKLPHFPRARSRRRHRP